MDAQNENVKTVPAEAVVPPENQPVIHAENVYLVGVEAADPNIEGDAIRDDFIYVLCCAFSCNNWEPKCWGGRSECTLLCYENSSACCKVVDDGKTCFLLQAGGLECVHPRKLYSEYYQLCCFECYAAVPLIEGKFKKIHNKHHGVTTNFRPSGDATLCGAGYCCAYTSCACNPQTCCGFYGKGVHCCYQSEFIQMKPLCCTKDKPNPDTWCIWQKSHTALVHPKTCVKSITQFYCFDCRCALPCDEEVPCVYGLCCCCTLCVDWQFLLTCCNTINQIADKSRAKRGLPPVDHAAIHARNLANESGAHQMTKYTTISAPPTQEHIYTSNTEYKQAPTSAPVEAVVVSEDAYENKI